MSTVSKLSKTAIASAAATLLLAGCAGSYSNSNDTASASKATTTANVKCAGINSCKGKGACAGAGHACAGKNSCKGQGWVKASKADCKAKGGEIIGGAEA